MEFDTYQAQARTTAVYPEPFKVIYPALGLAGEAGEVANKVKKIIRDAGGTVTDEVRENLKKELGDCLWYVAALASDLGLSLDDIAASNLEKLLDRKERGVLTGDGDNR